MFGERYRHTGARLVTARSTVTYLVEGSYPDPLIVCGGIVHIGTSSYEIAQALFQKERCIATCDTVHVNTDGSGAAALTDDMRAQLGALRVHT